ncbi:MAG: hypothetical protein ACOCXQ_01095 [Patescibacteria group bacterium]
MPFSRSKEGYTEWTAPRRGEMDNGFNNADYVQRIIGTEPEKNCPSGYTNLRAMERGKTYAVSVCGQEIPIIPIDEGHLSLEALISQQNEYRSLKVGSVEFISEIYHDEGVSHSFLLAHQSTQQDSLTEVASSSMFADHEGNRPLCYWPINQCDWNRTIDQVTISPDQAYIPHYVLMKYASHTWLAELIHNKEGLVDAAIRRIEAIPLPTLLPGDDIGSLRSQEASVEDSITVSPIPHISHSITDARQDFIFTLEQKHIPRPLKRHASEKGMLNHRTSVQCNVSKMRGRQQIEQVYLGVPDPIDLGNKTIDVYMPMLPGMEISVVQNLVSQTRLEEGNGVFSHVNTIHRMCHEQVHQQSAQACTIDVQLPILISTQTGKRLVVIRYAATHQDPLENASFISWSLKEQELD